jgi:hypothetical protein
MRERWVKLMIVSTLVVSGLSVFSGSAQATLIISGIVNTAGLVNVSGGPGSPGGPNNGVIMYFSTLATGGVAGFFDLTGGNTGTFAPITQTPGVPAGTITNLTNVAEPVGPAGFAPVNFMNFTGTNLPTIQFFIDHIPFGSGSPLMCGGTPTPGQVCTPPGSPFTLTNLGNPGGPVTGVSIAFSVLGFAQDSSSPPGPSNRSDLLGAFSTQLPSSLQATIATIASGGTISTSYSANFNTVVPEPATVSLCFGSLLVLAAGFAKKRRSK